MPARLLRPALLALLLLACGARFLDTGGGSSPGGGAAPQVAFPTVGVTVELARTDAARGQGLGGHAPLDEREGMLFIFEQPGLHAFWMKGMTFPLDIIWIEDERVVHVEAGIPAPSPNEDDSSRPIYSPAAPARYVLEVNAGFAQKYGISRGTPAQLKGL